MNNQTFEFAIKKSNNIVTEIGKSYIPHPDIRFSGGGIKWYEDKPKQQHNNKNG